MLPSAQELFCLSCGVDLLEPLRRTASLRCHDCRDAGEPISFELALRARDERRAWALDLRSADVSGMRPRAA
jgi:hypothetical protein